jgi:hypothetical protein
LKSVKERLLARSTERSECDEVADQAEAAHKVTRIALVLCLANL